MIVEIDKDLEDIFPRYLMARRDDLSMLREVLARGDFSQLQSYGHKIAGNAGAYGLDGYSAMARDLERSARAEDAGACQSHIDSMARYLSQIEPRFL